MTMFESWHILSKKNNYVLCTDTCHYMCERFLSEKETDLNDHLAI